MSRLLQLRRLPENRVNLVVAHPLLERDGGLARAVDVGDDRGVRLLRMFTEWLVDSSPGQHLVIQLTL